MPKQFQLQTDYTPAGDQPGAIASLVEAVKQGEREQVLLGVTGSGKTFTMANVIAQMQRPAIIMAHNKTLAAQLYTEMKGFFPDNAVEYFVSYYDYYQPEAYIPGKDVYIEKDSAINEQIDLMRHSATRNLLTRRDVIVVASVSCIYGLGAPEKYLEMTVKLALGDEISMTELARKLTELSYVRNEVEFIRGHFRIKGDIFDIFPTHLEDTAWRISFFGNEIEAIHAFDPLTGHKKETMEDVHIFANSHFVTPRPTLLDACKKIKIEMKERVEFLEKVGKLVEAQRLQQRTMFDLEMITEMGSCKGIENYSRYLSGRTEGEAPPTLFEYFPDDSLLFVDESHVSVPQIGGMYHGDASRKGTLVDYGFRLPSAKDNRPLKFEEWDAMRPQTIYVSATPGKKELEQTGGAFIEQVIRPTGLVDPPYEIRPATTQVDDLLEECRKTIAKGYRILVTALTKKSAEHLSSYLEEIGLKVTYMHSDIHTIERMEIIGDLRRGVYDILIGVNLLREGLDIPECGLMAILDADKEGFLRSDTSLIQTIGRAARNVDSHVILYADKMTGSMERALAETDRRRAKQLEHNKTHNITPRSVVSHITDNFLSDEKKASKNTPKTPKLTEKDLEQLKKEMLEAAANLEFEKAAELRDTIHQLESKLMGIPA